MALLLKLCIYIYIVQRKYAYVVYWKIAGMCCIICRDSDNTKASVQAAFGLYLKNWLKKTGFSLE